MNTLPGPRLYFIDSIRVFNMMMVVLLHSTLAYAIQSYYPWPVVDSYAVRPFGYLLISLHEFTMPLFFLISGFFAGQLYHQLGLAGFIRQRFIRIGIPLLVGMFIVFMADSLSLIRYTLQQLSLQHISTIDGAIFLQQLKIQFSRHIFAQFYNHLYYLWFLYYLIILYGIILLLMPLKKYTSLILSWLKVHTIKIAMQPWLLAAPIAILIFTSPYWYVDIITTFDFYPTILINYLCYFGFGWLLQQNEMLRLKLFSKVTWHYLIIQLFLCIPGYFLLIHYTAHCVGLTYYLGKLAGCYCYALGSWLMIFFIFTFSYHYLNNINNAIRYLAGASYWIYLLQIPLIIYWQNYFKQFYWFNFVKLIFVVLLTLTLLLISYACLVRHTLIGKILNGNSKSRY